MPVASSKPTAPKNIQPYIALGVSLDWHDGGEQAVGECPFCGKEGKFSVEIATSLFRCWACRTGNEKGGGNSAEFVKQLHKVSAESTTEEDYRELATDRKLLKWETLQEWGLAKSIITREWLMPGYNADSTLCSLHRYVEGLKPGKRVLRATAGLNLHMFGVQLLRPSQQEVWIVESWNALALRETLMLAGGDYRNIGVVGVPGCNVFQQSWARAFAGKDVVLAFDNDHPRQNRVTGATIAPAGFEGTQRTATILSGSDTPPASIRYVSWGTEGYDPDLPSGYDIRDHLTQSASTSLRIKALAELQSKVQAAPEDWTSNTKTRTAKDTGGKDLKPLPCRDWTTLRNALRAALRSRQEIEDVFLCMLAVAASTSQTGDQIFLMVLADAGSAKTRLCDAMLVSKNCYALEHLTGFHSGWKGEGGEDCSLISRINHMTLITPEGDVVASSPNFDQIMSQQRRIFDGKSKAEYKNSSTPQEHSGLRTPWIMAGTPALLDKNQARLGDRFIKIFIDPPAADEKQKIIRNVGFAALRSVKQTSNGDATTSIEEYMCHFYQLAGGYVDYLRENMPRLINDLVCDEDELVDECGLLAEFSAMFRSRPAPTKKDGEETHNTAEMPTRLTAQYVRLAACTAVASILREGDPPVVTEEVMRQVRKVAVDTCRGRTLKIAAYLLKTETDLNGMPSGGRHGRYLASIAGHLDIDEGPCKNLLRFMRTLDIVEPFQYEGSNQIKWRMTERATFLYNKAVHSGTTH